MHATRAILFAALAATVSCFPSTKAPFLTARVSGSCSASDVSCSVQDSCCVPDNGILVLSVQWLTGYCASNSCNIQAPSNWTLHGLWPDDCSGNQVGFCDQSRQYTDVAQRVQSFDNNLYQQLLSSWVSFKGSDTDSYNTFWSHEWQRHGTCFSPASNT
ncbi:ribonuclease T2-like protein, partial [Blyttiomyces helicus]